MTNTSQHSDAIFSQIDTWTAQSVPYCFIIDFECKHPIVCKLDEAESLGIKLSIGKTENPHTTSTIKVEKHPIQFGAYKQQFDTVMYHLLKGNSFLVNLTCETPITSNCSLNEIYEQVSAKYKLLLKDEFVCFSPETFIQIHNNKISTFPMKGTIDASIPDAQRLILDDEKEIAEHATIVDLLRNDLSIVADNVEVKRYRYIDKIKTSTKTLLQVSSEIEGTINKTYDKRYGSLIKQLLPAGSISGAPKCRTIEIIKESETHTRNYYTGVCGVFDGKNLDSFVMIRYIEQRDSKLFYKSGGGITFRSNAEQEYQEMIDKVYVPVV